MKGKKSILKIRKHIKMIEFVVKIADVNISIRALYEETQVFFEKFISDEEAVESIEVKSDKIQEYKEKYPHFDDRQCEKAIIKYEMDLILVEYDAFPVHASAIAYRNEAFLFSALSGVGKSTHSQKWKNAFGNEVVIINDDRPYLKMIDGKVYAYSHPQSGKHNRYTNASFPVLVIGKIIRDNSNYVKKIPKSDAFAFLMQQSFKMDITQKTSRIINLVRKIVYQVHFFEIHCNMDADAGKIICHELEEALVK